MTDGCEAVAAIFLLRDDGAALLQQRDSKAGLSHAGMWTPPGGHREPGESVEACARRGFEEETAYRLDDLHLLTELLEGGGEFPPQWLTIFWSVYDGVQQVECREGQALDFIRREEAGRRPIPQYLVELWDRAIDAGVAAGRLRPSARVARGEARAITDSGGSPSSAGCPAEGLP